MNPVTGYLFDKFGGKWLARIGLFLLILTTLPFTQLTSDTSFTFLSVVNMFRMLTIAMVMMPMTTLSINQLPKRLIPHGTAMNNTFRTNGRLNRNGFIYNNNDIILQYLAKAYQG